MHPFQAVECNASNLRLTLHVFVSVIPVAECRGGLEDVHTAAVSACHPSSLFWNK